MTDRARLTVERVEQIREYALAGKVDTILVLEQECVALCDHALAALRREPAAPDGGLSDDELHDLTVTATRDADFGTRLKACLKITEAYETLRGQMALRSLERPAGRVVPEDTLDRLYDDCHFQNDWGKWRFDHKKFAELVLQAASPPAATEGWVRVPVELIEMLASIPLGSEDFGELLRWRSKYAAQIEACRKWECQRCGCLWRLNPPSKAQPEGSWSLYDTEQKSCQVCDNSPEFRSNIRPAMPAPPAKHPTGGAK